MTTRQTLVPIAERQNRLELLHASLDALATWLTSEGASLEAVVITGDVSLAYNPDGFDALEDTLSYLGVTRPGPTHTVVVPGNHDVEWGTEPSSYKRYELFIERVRNRGYVTPLLEGVDIDSSGRLIDHPAPPLLRVGGGRTLIVAMNSANYCGSDVRMTDRVSEAVEKAREYVRRDPKALDELNRHFVHDVARISLGQMAALRTLLSAERSRTEGGPLRLLAMHHQLLPVSSDEEFKTFENLTNLGQVRRFLA